MTEPAAAASAGSKKIHSANDAIDNAAATTRILDRCEHCGCRRARFVDVAAASSRGRQGRRCSCSWNFTTENQFLKLNCEMSVYFCSRGTGARPPAQPWLSFKLAPDAEGERKANVAIHCCSMVASVMVSRDDVCGDVASQSADGDLHSSLDLLLLRAVPRENTNTSARGASDGKCTPQ